MKIRVQFKDPDGPSDAVQDAAKEFTDTITGLSSAERDAVAETRAELIRDKLGKWLRYGEYITIEFDIEAMTATVIEAK